ncbi:hypothetical protein [Nocardioides conyzicola]|uniref:DUF3592 domain-containing protein n=1 Tax=Nocardioides conyzicola TaxID=1651781 RepID=A0ABP8XPP9_9ACTN
MSAEAIAAPTTRQRRPRLGDLAHCGIAWALLICCVALLVTGLVVGERTSSYGDLRAAVARGDVDSVVVTGGMAESYIGRQDVTVHWRDGVFRYQAQVVEQHPQRRTETRAGRPVVYSVEGDLAERDAGVVVERRPHDFPEYNEVYGWRLPEWTSAATFVVGFTGLLLLISGPPPRRATRWAWFWLMWTAPPVGFLAFVVLSGVLSPRPPAQRGRRLTGGWAFLLAGVVGVAFSAVLAAFV